MNVPWIAMSVTSRRHPTGPSYWNISPNARCTSPPPPRIFMIDITEYEKILRNLKEDMAAHNISPFYFANAGTILRKENFMKRNLYSTQIFEFVDQGYVDDKLITVTPASSLPVYLL